MGTGTLILDFSRARRREDQPDMYISLYILRKYDALLHPIGYNKNHVIFIIFAKTNSFRELLCEMCIYL